MLSLFSSGFRELDSLFGGGYPDRSTILVTGQVAVGKEILAYGFMSSGIREGNACLYVTRQLVNDVLRDTKARGIDLEGDTLTWIAAGGSEKKFAPNNLAKISFEVKEFLKMNREKNTRILLDSLSSLLLTNSSDTVYRFLSQLFAEIKLYNACILSVLEEEMHTPSVIASMEQIFDGVLRVDFGEGASSAIEIKKMTGVDLPGRLRVNIQRSARVSSDVEVAPEGKRRLAAIMFTDIVGFTALGQRNESLSLTLVDEQRKLIRPILKAHQGREVKTIGDAFLVEFASALEAVKCSYDIQSKIREFNATLPEERRIHLRIGLHLGDIVESPGDKNDIAGDAVNVSSRIQELAEDGGVCLTRQIVDHVQNKIQLQLASLGAKSLKNVSAPIEIFKIVMPWEETRPTQPSSSPPAVKSDQKRIAVLPFANMSPDPGDEYFADGMTEELITVISKIKDLRVIARTSIMSYKGTTKRVSEIGRELNVGSILDGSVRKIGNRMRVSVQVVDAGNEEHLWAESYDREFEDIFSVQTDIAKQVSRTLRAKLRSRETELIAKKPTDSIDAYACYMKGRVALHGRTKQAMEEATKYFRQAITKDTRYARAYSGLADSILIMTSYGYIDSKNAYSEAKEFISKAIELDENLSEAHVSLGFLLELQYDFLGAKEEFERAISLNPSDSLARHWYAINLAIFNRLDEAIRELERALEADPLSPQIRTVLGGFYAYTGKEEEALAQWEKVLRNNPNNVPVLLNRGIYFAIRSRKEESLSDMNKAMELSSKATVVKCLLGYVSSILGEREKALEILREIKSLSEQAGEYVSPFYFAILYAGLGDKEETFSFLGKAIEDKSAEIESLLHDPMFESIRSDPRFEVLLSKAGIPRVGSQISKGI